MFWGEKFTPVNMTSCGRRNIWKHKEIKNGEQYIVLDISSKLHFMDRREFNSSESRNYTIKAGEGLTTYLDLRTKGTNKKQRESFSITDINNQDFRKLLKDFRNSYCKGYKSK